MKCEILKQIIISADDGKYLTNGETYGKTVVLPDGGNINEWYEITNSEYDEVVKGWT